MSNTGQSSMRDIRVDSPSPAEAALERRMGGLGESSISATATTSNIRGASELDLLFGHGEDSMGGRRLPPRSETSQQGGGTLDEASEFVGPELQSRRTRSDIQFSHVVPGEGDSSRESGDMSSLTSAAFLPTSNQLPTQTSSYPVEKLIRMDCPDPVTAGIISESDAFELFEL